MSNNKGGAIKELIIPGVKLHLGNVTIIEVPDMETLTRMNIEYIELIEQLIESHPKALTENPADINRQ